MQTNAIQCKALFCIVNTSLTKLVFCSPADHGVDHLDGRFIRHFDGIKIFLAYEHRQRNSAVCNELPAGQHIRIHFELHIAAEIVVDEILGNEQDSVR